MMQASSLPWTHLLSLQQVALPDRMSILWIKKLLTSNSTFIISKFNLRNLSAKFIFTIDLYYVIRFKDIFLYV